MDVIKQMIYTALRDDTTATVGLRALLGHSSTPYGVYKEYSLQSFDFTNSKKYITLSNLTGLPDISLPRHNYSTVFKEETYQIIAWGGDATTSNDKILDRVKYVLEGKRKTTNPTSNAKVFSIKCEFEGPDLFHEDYKIFYKSARFRIWLQDETMTGN